MGERLNDGHEIGEGKLVKDISKDVDGRLFAQVSVEIRRQPVQVFIYFWKTLIASLSFVSEGPFFRGRMFLKFLKVFFNVSGGVSLLEILRLTSLIEHQAKPGIIIEVGTWHGLSACCLSHIAANRQSSLWIIDTFSGLPQSGGPYAVSEGRPRNYRFEQGAFAGSYKTVESNLKRFGVPHIVSMFPGDVTKMEPLEFHDQQMISLAFIDVDLPESYRGAFRLLAGGIRQGTIFVLHEGLLDDVRAIAEDLNFWTELAAPKPRIVVFEHEWKARTLMTGLIFDG